MSVNEIVDRFKSTTVFRTGTESSFLSWSDDVSDIIFERMPEAVGGDDVELCKMVENFLTSIAVSSEIRSDARTNPNSIFWVQILNKLNWLGGFEERISHLTETRDLNEIVQLWRDHTASTFRDFFNLMCLLQKSKRTMLNNARDEKIADLYAESLNPAEAGGSDSSTEPRIWHIVMRSNARLFDQILSEGSPFRFGNAPVAFSNSYVAWSNVQRLILTNWRILPSGPNEIWLKGMGHPADAVNLPRDAVVNYLDHFYRSALRVSNRLFIHSPPEPLFHDADFILHAVRADGNTYRLIPTRFLTQKNSDIAAKSESGWPAIQETQFRGSYTYMIGAFAFDRIENLNKDVAFLLDGNNAEGDKLFEEILLIAGKRGTLSFHKRIREPYAVAGPSWRDWYESKLEKLRGDSLDRQLSVIGANSNATIFFNDLDFVTSHWNPTLVDVDAVFEVLVNGMGNYSLADGDVLDILSIMLEAFPKRTVLPSLFKFLDDDKLTRNEIQKILDETTYKNLEFYSFNETYDDDSANHFQANHSLLIKLWIRNFIGRQPMLNLFTEQLRTGGSDHAWLDTLTKDNDFFTYKEKAALFAAQRVENYELERANFLMLYLAMSTAPIDTAHIISKFVVVLYADDDDESLPPGVMGLYKRDFDELSNFYNASIFGIRGPPLKTRDRSTL